MDVHLDVLQLPLYFRCLWRVSFIRHIAQRYGGYKETQESSKWTDEFVKVFVEYFDTQFWWFLWYSLWWLILVRMIMCVFRNSRCSNRKNGQIIFDSLQISKDGFHSHCKFYVHNGTTICHLDHFEHYLSLCTFNE